MGIVVISDEKAKTELCGVSAGAPEIRWVSSLEEIPENTEVIVDLLFVNNAERISTLRKTAAATVIINSVVDTLHDTDPAFIRINGWPTFLCGDLIEASAGKEKRKAAEVFFQGFGKKVEWLPDDPGFIAPRVVSMIINEAFFALSENVSSREDINTAMKLGTNYPYGPFEWVEKIGLENIYALLSKLSKINKRYHPAPGLTAKTE